MTNDPDANPVINFIVEHPEWDIAGLGVLATIGAFSFLKSIAQGAGVLRNQQPASFLRDR